MGRADRAGGLAMTRLLRGVLFVVFVVAATRWLLVDPKSARRRSTGDG